MKIKPRYTGIRIVKQTLKEIQEVVEPHLTEQEAQMALDVCAVNEIHARHA